MVTISAGHHSQLTVSLRGHVWWLVTEAVHGSQASINAGEVAAAPSLAAASSIPVIRRSTGVSFRSSDGKIDSLCRIVMKNSDSVPQLQRFSYVHHCAARSRHGSHSRQCRHLLLQRQLAALLQCGPAGHGFGGLIQQLQDQSPEPLMWTVDGRGFWHSNESNLIVFFFLPNRPSLLRRRCTRRQATPWTQTMRRNSV